MEIKNNEPLEKDIQIGVVVVKYKIFIFVFLLAIYIFWRYLKDSVDQIKASSENITNLTQKSALLDNEISVAKDDLVMVNNISRQEKQIISCINESNGCELLSNNIKSNMDKIRNYFLMSKIEAKKMEIDEKKILANINEFLLLGFDKKVTGELNNISISKPTPSEYSTNILKSNISVGVTFKNKQELLNFINNVENSITTDYPVLYKVDSINYDIVNYQNTQNVNISLIAYFYK